MDRQIGSQLDRSTDKQIDRQIYSKIDRQTNRHLRKELAEDLLKFAYADYFGSAAFKLLYIILF